MVYLLWNMLKEIVAKFRCNIELEVALVEIRNLEQYFTRCATSPGLSWLDDWRCNGFRYLDDAVGRDSDRSAGQKTDGR